MPSRKVSAENTAALTGVVNVNRYFSAATTNTLSIIQSVQVSKYLATITHTVQLVQSVSHNQKWASAQNTITLSHAISKTNAQSGSASNQLVLTHSVQSTIASRAVISQLALSQSVDVSRPRYVSASNSLTDPQFTYEEVTTLTAEELLALAATRGLRQSVSVNHTIINLSVISYLQLTQRTAKYHPLSVFTQIPLTQSVSTEGKYLSTFNNLSLTQSVELTEINPASSTLSLTSTATYDAVFNRSLSSSLLLTHIVTVGTFDRDEVSIGYTPPTLLTKNFILLTHPYTSPTVLLELKTPEFDNVEQLEFRRINRRTRGNTLEIYRAGYWPKAERLILKFIGLTEAKAKDLLVFFDKSLGDEIGLLDHENRQWRGIITTPAEKIVDRDGRGCNFSADFEFEGVCV